MTYVITERCVSTKDTSCVEICPVDCIHPTADEPGFAETEQLFINPDECIDCGACTEACPVDAPFLDALVPTGSEGALELNAAFYADGAA